MPTDSIYQVVDTMHHATVTHQHVTETPRHAADSVHAMHATVRPIDTPHREVRSHSDSLLHIITVPRPSAKLDTVISTNIDVALAARYSTSGIDTARLVSAIPPPPPTWEQGLEGVMRPINAGDNSGVLTIVTGVFVLMMLSYRKYSRLFSSLFRALLGMRRPNIFDEHTSKETGVITLMALQWSVYTGLLLYTLMTFTNNIPPVHAMKDVLLLIAMTSSYYIFQLCAYNAVGYTFAEPEGQRCFVEGFTSSQSLVGFLLVVPALVAIFYHTLALPMLVLGGFFYFLARLLFIVKGFRIFYQNIWSLLYFILYLCTLEIIPLIVIYNLALLLVGSD